MVRWNHYVCRTCYGVTIARMDDEGVTPFLLRCRCKDSHLPGGIIVPGCKGLGESQFFNVTQDDSQKPHVIFYRPAPIDAIREIKALPETYRQAMLEHYTQGGCLLREVIPGLPATEAESKK